MTGVHRTVSGRPDLSGPDRPERRGPVRKVVARKALVGDLHRELVSIGRRFERERDLPDGALPDLVQLRCGHIAEAHLFEFLREHRHDLPPTLTPGPGSDRPVAPEPHGFEFARSVIHESAAFPNPLEEAAELGPAPED